MSNNASNNGGIKVEELKQTWLLVTGLGTFNFQISREEAAEKWAAAKQCGDFRLPDGGFIPMPSIKGFVIGTVNHVAPVDAAAMAALQRANGKGRIVNG